jgi:hypothetical protein
MEFEKFVQVPHLIYSPNVLHQQLTQMPESPETRLFTYLIQL